MVKGWFDKGYTNVALMQDPIADWQKGKVAIGFDSHSWIRLGRSVWGNEVIQGALPQRPMPATHGAHGSMSIRPLSLTTLPIPKMGQTGCFQF
jgi:hypothetical protein